MGRQRGIPNVLTTHTRKLDNTNHTTPDDAVQLYRQSGGRLTDSDMFGNDSIAFNPEKRTIILKYTSFGVIINELVNGEPQNLKV